MTTMKTRFVLFVAAIALIAAPAFAQATAEAKGKVVDAEGKPVEGAIIILKNVMPPNMVYEEKTDKKGNYYFGNLLHYPADKSGNGRWQLQIKADGFGLAKLRVESRRADKTLIGDPFDTKIKVGGAPTEIRISGLGEAKIDFVLEKGQVADAAPAAEAAPAPTPDDPWDLARARVQAGDMEGSVELLRKAIEARPDEAERRQLLAYALLKLDRFGEAEAQALKATEIAPGQAGNHLILAEIYKAKGDNDRAWEALQKERGVAPDNVRVLERIASLASEMGRVDPAIEAEEAITRLDADNAEAWIALGGLYAKKGWSDKSEQAFRKVVELDPTNAHQTFYNIGAVILNKPDLTDTDNRKAVEAFRKAVELKPDYAAAHRELAYALLRSNDREGARRELEKYLELEPQAPDAAEIQGTVRELKKK